MKLNWLPNLTLLLFGLIFTVEALEIPVDDESIGARLVPLWMSVGMTVLVVAQIIADLRARSNAMPTKSSIDPATESAGTGTIDVSQFIYKSAPLILLMALYGVLHGWFGYLLASVLTSYLVFALFGNNIKTVLIQGTIGSAVLFFLFVKLLNIYDPPGSLIDLSGL